MTAAPPPAVVRFGGAVTVRAAAAAPLAPGGWSVVRRGSDTATLVCLELRCAPPRLDGRTIRIVVRPRVRSADARFEAQTAPPPWRYRVDPTAASVALYVLAALLLAAAVLAWWRPWLDRRTALERAVAAVREARARPAADRRKAVAALARELRRLGREEAGRHGDRVAWASAEPAPADLEQLLERIEP